ncbi:phycocyanobilin:ferredoxin oxidoreductase [Thalassoporum mexicanum PCC 7367]|uniref:phycocyanobilin:ferredoxin oxidoreductase n=1 Tax=Thalassoporum mexicanum TaxID=3457544 RepID=UPI00029F871B|nr:phycocyanobilin:ferredoxin oxidoreductase [Pseudanabaena sp. PCC 7367]AFY68978.1 phycocyanobilin:ferredoxin oxidoreductase [Pseudanabaena sp. PCC 7367]
MQLNPLIGDLAKQIELIWQQQLDLSTYQMPEDLGYVEGTLEGEKVVIKNYCYQSPTFRKLHIEVARIGDNVDILHCVMYPHSCYELPIFGADLVGTKHGISAAIADLSPTVPLSEAFTSQLNQWQPQTQHFSQPRELPAWGSIFSPYCIFVRLNEAAEEKLFLELVQNYVTLNCQVANHLAATGQNKTGDRQQEILAHQQFYCAQQRQNDKTRRILEKVFGAEWADRYINTVLFDVS